LRSRAIRINRNWHTPYNKPVQPPLIGKSLCREEE
jgi:hypothetical protein